MSNFLHQNTSLLGNLFVGGGRIQAYWPKLCSTHKYKIPSVVELGKLFLKKNRQNTWNFPYVGWGVLSPKKFLTTGYPKKKMVFRKIAKPLVKWPFRAVKWITGGSNKCGHIGDMCQTPGYGIDVLSTPKYPYFDSSSTSKQEFCYIPKDNLFLGYPVFCSLLLKGGGRG